MKVHTTNYTDTFIEVAEDCPADQGENPPEGKNKSIAKLQYEMIKSNPYRYTSDEVLYSVFATRKDFSEAEWEIEKRKFFSKGQPCFRASHLTKRYGWGIHCDGEGKIAMYGRETEEYQNFVADTELKKVKAMRSKR